MQIRVSILRERKAQNVKRVENDEEVERKLHKIFALLNNYLRE